MRRENETEKLKRKEKVKESERDKHNIVGRYIKTKFYLSVFLTF